MLGRRRRRGTLQQRQRAEAQRLRVWRGLRLPRWRRQWGPGHLVGLPKRLLRRCCVLHCCLVHGRNLLDCRGLLPNGCGLLRQLHSCWRRLHGCRWLHRRWQQRSWQRLARWRTPHGEWPACLLLRLQLRLLRLLGLLRLLRLLLSQPLSGKRRGCLVRLRLGWRLGRRSQLRLGSSEWLQSMGARRRAIRRATGYSPSALTL